MLSKHPFHHVEILVKHCTSNLPPEDAHWSVRWSAVHIGIPHPDSGQAPLSSEVGDSHLPQRSQSFPSIACPSDLLKDITFLTRSANKGSIYREEEEARVVGSSMPWPSLLRATGMHILTGGENLDSTAVALLVQPKKAQWKPFRPGTLAQGLSLDR
jgi:hypothetical protein